MSAESPVPSSMNVTNRLKFVVREEVLELSFVALASRFPVLSRSVPAPLALVEGWQDSEAAVLRRIAWIVGRMGI